VSEAYEAQCRMRMQADRDNTIRERDEAQERVRVLEKALHLACVEHAIHAGAPPLYPACEDSWPHWVKGGAALWEGWAIAAAEKEKP